ncbi:uncharacterized protein LOC135684418 isoform X2 [Rhopilema esculentum]
MQQAIPLMLMIAVTLLSNFFFGILTCILAGVMLIVKLVHVQSTSERIFPRIVNFAHMILKSMALISWWIFACLWGYNYIGGLPWRGESEDGYPFNYVIEKFTEGEIFDAHRFLPWFTILFIMGITLECLNLMPQMYGNSKCSKKDQTYSLWIISSTFVSFALFLGRTTFSGLYNWIPLHTELEAVKYLSAIHFCGLLHVSYAISRIVNKLAAILNTLLTLPVFLKKLATKLRKSHNDSQQQTKVWKKAIVYGPVRIYQYLSANKLSVIQFLLVLGLACFLWRNHFKTVSSHLTMTEVRQEFIEKLESLKKGRTEGRMLGHRGFGSASSFDLAFLPHYTGKAGLMTYSRGYHDSLSVFYLESLRFNPDRMQIFANTLRLYNVHFIATSDIQLDEAFVKACQLKQIAKVEDLIFYEVLHEENDYGYFDFVRLPGYISGDLKLIRQVVLRVSELYNVNSLLLINPKRTIAVNDNVVADVEKRSLWNNFYGQSEEKLQVTWSSNGVQTDSETLLDKVIKSDSWKWIYSQVVEERFVGVDYQAIVHVSDRGQSLADMEHLLLKVTYHPFWKCFYYPVSRDFTLDMFQTPKLLDGKTYTNINHVTPNLMSVSLPPGRYLVVFTYRFPGILKILAFFCGCWYVRLLTEYMWGFKTCKTSINGKSNKCHLNKQQTSNSHCQIDSELEIDTKSTVKAKKLNGNPDRFRKARESLYVKSSAEDVANDVTEIFTNENPAQQSKNLEAEADGSGKAWKVTGRLRSHSIAAENKLKNQTLTLLNSLPGATKPTGLQTISSDESGEWIDLTGKISRESKDTSDDSKSDKSDESDISSVRSDESDVRSSDRSNRSSGEIAPSNESRLLMTTGQRQESINSTTSDFASSPNDPTVNGEMLDANANILSDACEIVQDFSANKDSLHKVAAILQSSSSESVDQNDHKSISNLRSRLEKLNKDDSEEKTPRQDGGKIVKELRQTYLRQRRNTLSALPSLRK